MCDDIIKYALNKNETMLEEDKKRLKNKKLNEAELDLKKEKEILCCLVK